MTKSARLATSVAALALAAAATSCGQQTPQQPRNQAQQSEAQQRQAQQQPPQAPEGGPEQPKAGQGPQDEPHQTQAEQAKQPEPQEPQAQQAQSQPQQPEPQQPQAQQAQNQPQQPEPQQPQAQQAQNPAQPVQQSANESVGQNAAASLSEGAVRQIQQALEQKGFKVGPLDGKLGPRTKRALSQFQRRQRLQQTGTPDEQTLTALGIGGAASTSGQGPSGAGGVNPNETPSTRRLQH